MGIFSTAITAGGKGQLASAFSGTRDGQLLFIQSLYLVPLDSINVKPDARIHTCSTLT